MSHGFVTVQLPTHDQKKSNNPGKINITTRYQWLPFTYSFFKL